MDPKERSDAIKKIHSSRANGLDEAELAEKNRVLGAKFEMFRHLKELAMTQIQNDTSKVITGVDIANETNEIMGILEL